MYRTEDPFPYAEDYYGVFPTLPLEKRIQPPKGTCVFTDEYTLFFRDGTPKEIIKRLTNDYARFRENEMKKNSIQ